jgi:hypothetical protein
MTLISLPDNELATPEEIALVLGREKAAAEARSRLQQRLEEVGMCIRDDPSLPKTKGPIDMDNALVHAVIKTMAHGYSAERFSIYYFLNPPKLGLNTTPFTERLAVMIKLYVEGCRIASSYPHKEGDIFDPTSGYIINYDTTPYFWMGDYDSGGMGLNWEALFDTSRPDTRFACYTYGHMSKLRAMHETRSLFEDGPAEFILHCRMGWYIPIIGVREISYTDLDFSGGKIKRKLVTLDSSGVSERELPPNYSHDASFREKLEKNYMDEAEDLLQSKEK